MELTEEQKSIVTQLSKPEENSVRYNWDENFQRRIIGMALTDGQFLVQAISLIKPEYFNNECHYLTCKKLFEYFEQYRNIPEKFVITDLINREITGKDDPVKIYYNAEIESIYEAFVPTANSRDILLDKVLKFARIQELKIAMSISTKELRERPEDQEVWEKAEERIKKALATNKSVDTGYDFLVDREKFYQELSATTSGVEKFSPGLHMIDSLVKSGWQRGELHAFMALTGQGKSLALSKVAVENLKRHKKVVFISLELAWVTVCQRFVGQFAQVDINEILQQKHNVEEVFEEYTKELQDKNLFNIKQYSLGSPTVMDIRAYLTNLKSKGFIFDVVIVDYAGEIKQYSGVKTYESQAMIMRDLKCMAQEENCVVVTAMQSNKEGTRLGEAESLNLGNIAASFDQAQKLDSIWSITRSPDEVNAGLGRVTGIKVRNGQTGSVFPVRFNRNTLDINCITDGEYKTVMQEYRERMAGAVDQEVNIDNRNNRRNRVERNAVEDDEE
jgi:replicative DNA helicase